MAKIGVKYLKAAPWDSTTSKYSGGYSVASTISADVSINSKTGNLWADNKIKETRTKFVDGTLALDVDDLEQTVLAKLLGKATKDITVGSATVKALASKISDAAPIVGVGFYQTVQRSNVDKYRAIVVLRVQFAEPKDTVKTSDENVSFQTSSISGTITSDDEGYWKYENVFDTEAEAVAFIDAVLPTA